MTFPKEDLDRNMDAFMLFFRIHIDPILHRTRFQGRGFLESEIKVATVLAQREELSPTQLSRHLNMQKGSLTSVLRRLERLGFVMRRDMARGGRRYLVRLTPAGQAFAEHLARQRRRGLDALFSTMPPERIAEAAHGLGLIAEHLEMLEEETMEQDLETRQKPLHWYHAASPEDREEYNAYGPWIVKVTSEMDMPPRFRPFYAADKDAQILLKVPRKEDRRELRPGMDLYRDVIALFDRGLTLRRLGPDGIYTLEFPWDRIAAIGCENDLLKGIWTIYAADGSRVDLEYNRVSVDTINTATDFVRDHLNGRGVDPAQAEGAAQHAVEIPATEVFFGSVLHEIQLRGPGPVTAIHFEPRGAEPGSSAEAEGAANGMMILETPHELVIVSRDSDPSGHHDSAYASTELFLPFARMTGYRLTPTGEGAMHSLALQLEKHAIHQAFGRSPDEVVSLLQSRGVPSLP
jgi:DNA-binding MarR family transcriptional regulator